MRRALLPLFALTLAAAAALAVKSPYPDTRTEPVEDTLFGTKVRDPYRWLEDAKAPEVATWMKAQDEFARGRLSSLPGRDRLAERLKQLLYVDSITPPVHRGTRYFYQRTHADREKAVLYWREGDKGAEQVLLDPNKLSTDGSVSLGATAPSWDGKRLAYALRANNADEATLYLKDVASGEVSKVDVIPGAKYARPAWTPKGDGFYYVWLPTDKKIPSSDRPGFAELRYHAVGTDPASDKVVHQKTGDPTRFLSGELSRDGRWLFVTISRGWTSDEVYYRDLTSPSAEWRPFVVGKEAHYNVAVWRDRFYVLTDEGAPRGRLYRVEAGKPERAAWKEIVPQAEGNAVLDHFRVVGEQLALVWMKDASSRLEVRTLDGAKVRDVPLPSLGTSGGLIGNPDEDDAYFSFTSFTRPVEIYRTSIKRGATSLWAQIKLPIDPTPFTVEQVWYASKDGTKVSMFIIQRKDAPRDGTTPFLLGGYGGFNVSMTPAFGGSLYPWLEAGGGYALPNLRGGGEYGEAWHQAGMKEKKQNVFDDHLAAAQFLIDQKYTRPDKLAIRGGSNGGLLVGAALTQRPELFRAVICAVPLLDMVRFHRFGGGKTWTPEYGTPEEESGFRPLYAYSPYHRVKAGVRYPSLLMLSADSDDRVDPLHARKMTAALQAAQGDLTRPILLRIEKNAGHGGADLVRQQIAQTADSWAFLMHELGMAAPR